MRLIVIAMAVAINSGTAFVLRQSGGSVTARSSAAFALRRSRGAISATNNSNKNNGDNKTSDDKRRIVRYDNVGDPIYEGDENATGTMNGLDVFGLKLDLDPTTLTLLGFGAIAFNFFVLANL